MFSHTIQQELQKWRKTKEDMILLTYHIPFNNHYRFIQFSNLT